MFIASGGLPTFCCCASAGAAATNINEAKHSERVIPNPPQASGPCQPSDSAGNLPHANANGTRCLTPSRACQPLAPQRPSEAKDRATIDAFTRSDPYCVHGVWDRIDVHYYRKKR